MPPLTKQIAHIRGLRRQNRLLDALELTREMVSQHPRSIQAVLWHGRILHALGRHEEVLPILDTLAELAPHHQGGITLEIDAASRLGDVEQMERAYGRFAHSLLLTRSRWRRRSRSIVSELLTGKLGPQNRLEEVLPSRLGGEAKLNRSTASAVTAILRGSWDDAARSIDRLLFDADLKHLSSHALLIALATLLERAEGCAKWFITSGATEPVSLRPYFLSFLSRQVAPDDQQKYRRRLRQLPRRLFGEASEAPAGSVRPAESTRRTTDAASHAETITRMFALGREQQRTEAIRIGEAAAREVPTSPHLWPLLGILYTQEGSQHRAREAYRRAVGIHPDQAYWFSPLATSGLSAARHGARSTAYLFCNGPSLAQLDFRKFEGRTVCLLNGGIRLYSQLPYKPAFVYLNDRVFANRPETLERAKEIEADGHTQVWATAKKNVEWPRQHRVPYYLGEDAVCSAITFLYRSGFSRVVLFGMDWNYPESGRESGSLTYESDSHFTVGATPAYGDSGWVFPDIAGKAEAMRRLALNADRLRLEIINATRDTRWQGFPKNSTTYAGFHQDDSTALPVEASRTENAEPPPVHRSNPLFGSTDFRLSSRPQFEFLRKQVAPGLLHLAHPQDPQSLAVDWQMALDSRHPSFRIPGTGLSLYTHAVFGAGTPSQNAPFRAFLHLADHDSHDHQSDPIADELDDERFRATPEETADAEEVLGWIRNGLLSRWSQLPAAPRLSPEDGPLRPVLLCLTPQEASDDWSEFIEIARSDAPDAPVLVWLDGSPIDPDEFERRIKETAVLGLSAFSLGSILPQVDAVYVGNSVSGFEALLRGKRVHCLRTPFYSGWGFTRDRSTIERSFSGTRSLTDIVVAALFRHSLYFDECGQLLPSRAFFVELRQSDQIPAVLFTLSNPQAGFDSIHGLLERFRANSPQTRLLLADFCEAYGNEATSAEQRSFFDETFLISEHVKQPVLDSDKRAAWEIGREPYTAWFQSRQPQLLIQNNDRSKFEALSLKLARESQVPTVLIQESIRRDDFFKTRDNGVRHGSPGNTRILAWGEQGRHYYRSVGVPDEKIRVCGSSRLDLMKTRFSQIDKAVLRGRYGLLPGARSALFATSPMHETSDMSPEAYLDAIHWVLDAAEGFLEAVPEGQVFIKHHRSESAFFRKHGLIDRIQRHPRLHYLERETIYEALALCDCVLNFSSTVAVEAALLGMPVGIVQFSAHQDVHYGVDYVERGIATGLNTPAGIRNFLQSASAAASLGEKVAYYVAEPGKSTETYYAEISELLGARFPRFFARERKGSSPRLGISVNASHRSDGEARFWESVSTELSRAGWNWVEVMTQPPKSCGEMLSLRAPGRFKEYLKLELSAKSPEYLPDWCDPQLIEQLLLWEKQRFALPQISAAAREGAHKLAWFVHRTLEDLQPDYLVTWNRFDPICALFFHACEQLRIPHSIVERSPFGGIWHESRGMYGLSEVWDHCLTGHSVPHSAEGAARALDYMRKNAANFRDLGFNERHRDQLTSLTADHRPVIFWPFDHVVGTHLSQEGHPEIPLDYPWYRKPKEFLQHIGALAQKLDARLVVKFHPSEHHLKAEDLPSGIDHYDGDLGPMLDACDAVVVMNTQVGFQALAKGCPTVCLSNNPLAASGASYFCSHPDFLEASLRLALERGGLEERLSRFSKLCAWLAANQFYKHPSETDDICLRGAEDWAQRIIEAGGGHASEAPLSREELESRVEPVRRLLAPRSEPDLPATPKQLRILSVQPALRGLTVHPFFGGKDVLAYNLARRCVDEGFDYFILPERDEPFFDEHFYALGEDGTHAILLPTCHIADDLVDQARKRTRRGWLKRKHADEDRIIRELLRDRPLAYRRALARSQPNIVHNHFTFAENLPADLRAAGYEGPLLLTHYSTGVGHDLEQYDTVVFLSETQREMACEAVPGARSGSVVIYPQVGPEFMRPHQPQSEGPLLFVGTMRNRAAERKGIDHLLKAYAGNPELNRQPLWIVGDGPDRSGYEAFAREEELNIQFLGWRNSSQIADLMARSRLFIMPSRGEGLAFVYLEALAMGLPFVGYPPNVIDLEQQFGFPVARAFDAHADDHHVLAQTILETLEDPDLNSVPYRRKIMEIARQKFRPGRASDEFVALYRRLVSG